MSLPTKNKRKQLKTTKKWGFTMRVYNQIKRNLDSFYSATNKEVWFKPHDTGHPGIKYVFSNMNSPHVSKHTLETKNWAEVMNIGTMVSFAALVSNGSITLLANGELPFKGVEWRKILVSEVEGIFTFPLVKPGFIFPETVGYDRHSTLSHIWAGVCNTFAGYDSSEAKFNNYYEVVYMSDTYDLVDGKFITTTTNTVVATFGKKPVKLNENLFVDHNGFFCDSLGNIVDIDHNKVYVITEYDRDDDDLSSIGDYTICEVLRKMGLKLHPECMELYGIGCPEGVDVCENCTHNNNWYIKPFQEGDDTSCDNLMENDI